MASGDEVFGERAAARYESWYATAEGRRADAEEKTVLSSLLDSFPGVGSVLEVGCGTGHFTRWLSDLGLAPVGLDVSAAMLEQAQALGGVPLVGGDGLHLPFAEDAFDLVVYITTLEFLERPRDALVEGMRVGRQGLLLGMLNRWSPLGLLRRLAALRRPTVYDAARFFGLAELGRLLRSVAMEDARIVWRQALLPRGWPRAPNCIPWGGFIGMALIADGGSQEVG